MENLKDATQSIVRIIGQTKLQAKARLSHDTRIFWTLFSLVWWMGKVEEFPFPFHNSIPMSNNFPKELFNHKLQLVTHWRGKRNKSVTKNQLFGPSRELKEAAFFYYYLAHPGVWLISAFMAHQDVLVSLLRTVQSVFLLFSGLTLHFLAASSTLLNAGGAWGSRLHLGDKKVTEPKGTAAVSFCSPPENFP